MTACLMASLSNLFEGSRRLQKTAIIKAEGLAAISGLLLTSCRKHYLLP